MPARSILIVNRMVLEAGKRKYRVVFIDIHTQITWLIDIADDEWAFPKSSSELQAQLDDGEIKPVEDPYGTPNILPPNSRSAFVQAERYELIKPHVNDIRKLLIKRERTIIVNSIEKSRQTTTLLLKLFLKRGMTQQAMTPDYLNCGRPKNVTPEMMVNGIAKRNFKPGAKKIGLPRTITPGVGINVDANVRKQLVLGADMWLSSRTVTLQAAVDHVVDTYYSPRTPNLGATEDDIRARQDLKPTKWQLHYFIKTEYPEEYIRRKRHGAQHYNLNERALIGWADSSVQGPGDQYQVDASVANVPLVSLLDRRMIVGYPVIYFTVDVFSRLITGVSVGYEGPSWVGATVVLINMVTPKVEFCRRYGIEIGEDEWPSSHAPKCIIADRAELLSVELGQNIIKNLGIDILNVTARRPDLKSLVERRFGIIKADFGSFIPGFVKDKFKDAPPVKDFRIKAVFNIYEFTQMLIRAVLVHNMTPIRDYLTPPEMVTEGLAPAPLDLWNWGIRNRSGCLNQISIEKTMINVMHRDQARVTEKGIRYKGMYYWSSTSIKGEWFARARRHEWPVTIGIEPHNMESILLLDSHLPKGYEFCEQIMSSIDYKSASLFEIEELQLANKKNIAATQNDRQPARITHERAIKNLLQMALREKQQLALSDRLRSNVEKIRQIGEAKARERALLQEQSSLFTVLGAKPKAPAASTSVKPQSTPYQDEISTRLNEERERRQEKAHVEHEDNT